LDKLIVERKKFLRGHSSGWLEWQIVVNRLRFRQGSTR
jgi:hypothetical protein